uniref:non-specific serine/threonine protein kinase n=1 Tax=Panagrolaimus superbus TaxID=310955 RepID=A0A914YL67_9BILA
MSITYVFELPTRVVLDLGMILDSGDVWEDVAITMPDITDIDINDCRRLRDNRTESRSTEALLRIWGSKGYTINDLYKVFARLKMIRCMKIIKEYVEPDLHMLETDCLSLPDVITSPKGNSTDGSSFVKPSTHQIHPSVSVYSKKTEGSSWSSLGDVETELTSGGGGSVLNDLQNTLAVKYLEILEATHNFAVENILGRGGYGTVYKGQWKHLFVAVKRIKSKKDSGAANEKERLRQSLQELRTLAKFRHDNILSLYGYSLDGPEPCLLYQYMANGSLEDRLLCRKGSSPLGWTTRFQISQGVSCGLHFLHSIGKAPMIHGDIKSANILLDRHMEPKIGDFGLCRDGQQEVGVDEKAPLIASHIKGTLAYLPPEFITNKILTTKLDV